MERKKTPLARTSRAFQNSNQRSNSTMNLPILQSEVKTMSSREIADLCGARHNDVITTIERLFSK